jgi:hypothetical protein
MFKNIGMIPETTARLAAHHDDRPFPTVPARLRRDAGQFVLVSFLLFCL